MNNKRLGMKFEREVVTLLSELGYWVHFITPDVSGAQPFDLIASKNDNPIVADCKTTAVKTFTIKRLEQNQVMAFEKWLQCGNKYACVYVKYLNRIYEIPYKLLKKVGKVNLEEYPSLMIKVVEENGT